MNRILNFFVLELNTVDGVRNSAQFYIDAATIYEIARQEKRMNKKIMAMRKLRPLKANEEYDGPLRLLALTK